VTWPRPVIRWSAHAGKLPAAIVSVIQGEESKIDLSSGREKLRVPEAAVNLHSKIGSGQDRLSLTSQRE